MGFIKRMIKRKALEVISNSIMEFSSGLHDQVNLSSETSRSLLAKKILFDLKKNQVMKYMNYQYEELEK